jgi:hypothetical protein
MTLLDNKVKPTQVLLAVIITLERLLTDRIIVTTYSVPLILRQCVQSKHHKLFRSLRLHATRDNGEIHLRHSLEVTGKHADLIAILIDPQSQWPTIVDSVLKTAMIGSRRRAEKLLSSQSESHIQTMTRGLMKGHLVTGLIGQLSTEHEPG